MFDELIHYEYIDDLCSIDIMDEKLLQIFSIYISSNRDFKYNTTYLIDSIANFKNIIETFRNKKERIIKFSESLSKNYVTPCDWIIILDDVFLIDNYFRFSTLTTFVKNYNSANGKNSSQVSEKIIKYHLKQFNLFSLKHKEIKVVYYNLTDERNYSYMGDFSDQLKLFDLVESDYIKLGAKEE